MTPQAETPAQRFSITVDADGRVSLHPGWAMSPEDLAVAGECWALVKEALDKALHI